MLVINTAKRYKDLDLHSAKLGLFETGCSAMDISDKFDLLVDENIYTKEITTLNKKVLEKVGLLIVTDQLDNQFIEIRIFEDSVLSKKSGFDSEGSLREWPIGLLDFE